MASAEQKRLGAQRRRRTAAPPRSTRYGSRQSSCSEFVRIRLRWNQPFSSFASPIRSPHQRSSPERLTKRLTPLGDSVRDSFVLYSRTGRLMFDPGKAASLVLIGLLLQVTCPAQTDPWELVKQLPSGTKVYVRLLSGKSVVGMMVGSDNRGLSVRRPQGNITVFGKPDVEQVAFVNGISRKRKAAYGGAIAGGVMSVMAGLACGSNEGCCGTQQTCSSAEVVGVVAFIGAVGAGIGFLIPQHKRVIYRFPPKAPNVPGTPSH